MTDIVDNTQMLSLSFPDIMTQLYLIWESSEKQKQHLQQEVEIYKKTVDEMTAAHTELLNKVEILQNQNNDYVKEISQLKKKLNDAEDDQKQFRKVSHILTMDRENSNYKQQIAILERRVSFYQNQCNNMKTSNDVVKIDKQTDIDDLFINETCNEDQQSSNSQNNNKEIDIITYNDDSITNKEKDIITYNDESINVKEKKIKGVIYYLSDDGQLYIKNDDSSIGELKGKLEYLPSGKTKVKWYKS